MWPPSQAPQGRLAMRSFVRSLLLLAGLLGVGPVQSARADPPEFATSDDTFEDPFFSEVCGFPVEVHIQGTVAFRTTGTGGSDFSQLRVTYTNLDTGRSVEAHFS